MSTMRGHQSQPMSPWAVSKTRIPGKTERKREATGYPERHWKALESTGMQWQELGCNEVYREALRCNGIQWEAMGGNGMH